MSASIIVTSARTEELNADTRASIIHVCCTAHQKDDFIHLFTYIPSGGIHVLAYREQELVSHAVATTRWLQPKVCRCCARPMSMPSQRCRRIRVKGLEARSCAISHRSFLSMRLPV